jgi:hypothetical protein
LAKVKSLARAASRAAINVLVHDRAVRSYERTIAVTVGLAIASALGIHLK